MSAKAKKNGGKKKPEPQQAFKEEDQTQNDQQEEFKNAAALPQPQQKPSGRNPNISQLQDQPQQLVHHRPRRDKIFMTITLRQILVIYFKIMALMLCFLAVFEEGYVKGTWLNKHIRKYFNLECFEEYTAQHPPPFALEETVAECDYLSLGPKQFFNEFVARERPCLFKGYGKTWPAYEKWKNETYLREAAGNEVIYPERQMDNRFAYFTEGAKRVYMTFGEFLDKFQDENRTFHYYYSFEDPPGPLSEDIIVPPIMDALFQKEKVTYWHGYGTLTKPHTDSMENMMCVFEGYKNFTIVSPSERYYVYAGYNGLPRNYSPIEFVSPDYSKWPLFRKTNLRTVHIAPGDCLYLPAYWWHQVGSSPGVSIGVATWFKTHHVANDIVHFGMQAQVI